jgi:hypothetical protein
MKKIIFLILIVNSAAVIQAQEKLPLEGAWNLVHAWTKIGNRTIAEFPVTYAGSQCKIWTLRNYLFVGRFREKGTFSDSYGGGIYNLDGNRYEEIIQYNNNSKLIDKKVEMHLEIKNDTLTQIFPVVSNGQPAKDEVYYIYKYVRIK